ncbi:MAG: SpoIID/LytB domain-containing protein [Eubacteriales bacterium]|nr:SpoIID/LytB domain-containing protein [Eubacteriales bacterium]
MKKRTSLLCCVAALIACMCIVPAAALETDVTLRVGLTAGGANTFTEPKLENVAGEPTGYTVGRIDGTTFVGSTPLAASQLTIRLVDDAFQVSDTASGKVLYTTDAGADHLAIRPNSALTWFKGYQWPGDFMYRRASGGSITVINYVAIEDYVKGVLPYEIDPDWPIEAQKAQAVCARSFALGTHKHTDRGYDLCNTTNCQVYLGANKATATSDAAVDATRGQYLVYEGEPVIGYFFSSDGGATEDAVNVWGGDYPYLKGKIDPYETHNVPWSVTLSAEQIRQKLQSAGYTIGPVADVRATDNVGQVTITDTAGNTVTLERSKVRTVFGLKSIRYTITPNGASTVAARPQRTSLRVVPSTHKVKVDGEHVAPQGYNVEGNNYYKLRDIAYILNGTKEQFGVAWDGAGRRILLAAGQAYRPVGGEMRSTDEVAVKSCVPSTVSIELDGAPIALTGYNINGNNYYKIRDVGKALGFTVDYKDATVLLQTKPDAEVAPIRPSVDPEGGTTTPSIDPEEGATPPTAPESSTPPAQPEVTNAVSYTFKGAGWGHSVGMSQWGACAMAEQGYDYKEILRFYFTGISVAG